MTEEPKTSDQASIQIIVRGAKKTYDNAERLFREAEILANNDMFARALCLHQISLEECSKVNNLYSWAMSIVLGLDVDQKKILTACSHHSAKNKSNAYMLTPSEAEKEARDHGDWKAAMAAFRQTQVEFHTKSNQDKNASLYVDLIDGEFVAPSERITKDMLDEITERNAEFLGYAHHAVQMLERLEKTPDATRELLGGFVEQAKKLRDEEPDDPMLAIEALLSKLFENALQKNQNPI